MSCFARIKEAEASLTGTEMRIAKYLLDHQNEAIYLSSQTLAELTKTSPAALIRFSKKIGYKGFTELKVDLAKDDHEDFSDVDDLINENDSLEALVKKALFTNQKTLNATYQLIDYSHLKQAIEILSQANRIYLLGIGGNGVVCIDLMHKLSRINIDVIYHEDAHIQLASFAHIQADDAVLALSYGGKTKEVNAAVEYAKKAGAKVVAMTQFNTKSVLSKLADVVLLVPVQEKEFRLGAIASRNAFLILTDLLYFGIAKKNIQETKNNLKKSREIVQMLK